MLEQNYRCSQDELYEGARLLANSLEVELSNFGFKAKYNAAYITNFRQMIADARALPC
jgi:hypothetical protein